MSRFYRALFHVLCLALCVGLPASLQAQEKDCYRAQNPGGVTEVGKHAYISETFPSDRLSTSLTADRNTRYMRALIKVNHGDACTDWLLTVRDQKLRIAQTLGPADFNRSMKTWTNRIIGREINFDLKRCAASQWPEITFERYLAMPDDLKGTYYSSQSQEVHYHFLYPDSTDEIPLAARRLGDAVGFLMGSWTDGAKVYNWSCSGVLVSANLFLTNWHCGGPFKITENGREKPYPKSAYWKQEIIEGIIIDLSWDEDNQSREYVAVQKIDASEGLDFALIEVRALNSLGKALPATISLKPLAANDEIRVVQHPVGLPKQISDNGCKVTNPRIEGWASSTLDDVEGDKLVDFSHNCDTEGGSSGAPIFNSDGQLIGLHHLGFKFDPVTCERLDRENKGVRIDRIIKHLTPYLSARKEKLITQE